MVILVEWDVKNVFRREINHEQRDWVIWPRIASKTTELIVWQQGEGGLYVNYRINLKDTIE